MPENEESQKLENPTPEKQPEPVAVEEKVDDLENKVNLLKEEVLRAEAKEYMLKKEVTKQKQKLAWIITIVSLLIIGAVIAGGWFFWENQRKNSSAKDSSNSSKSSQSQSSKIDSSNSKSSTQSTTNSTQNNSSKTSRSFPALTETYTNQFYPNLKIKYDKSWTFSTTTQNSIYPGVLGRTVKLSKGGVDLMFLLSPKFVTGCNSPNVPSTRPLGLSLQNGKLDRYDILSNNKFYYLQKGLANNIDPEGCILNGFMLKSTVTSAEYTKTFPDEKTMTAIVSVYAVGTDENIIQEADNIIDNSTFSD